jgi:uncharacterized protein YqgV (UPF0045/DUF77 family)
MSVLMNLAIFPTDQGSSVSGYVSKVIRHIRRSGHPNQLTAMGTLVETETLHEATLLIEETYKILEHDCERVYITASFDVRKGGIGRIESKIRSIEDKLEGKD